MGKHTGWEIEYRTHFDSIVDEYEKTRPEWIHNIYDDIVEYAKPHLDENAIEIGVGTGKATTPILNIGYNVTAIEINPRMAEFSLNRFRNYNNFKVIVSSFEDALLEDNSYSLIYAASAFHWVNAEVGLPKALRLLSPGGTIALFRYNEIASVTDELYNRIRKIYNQYYDPFYEIPYRQPVRQTHDDFCLPSEIYKGYRFENLQAFGFHDVTMKFYDVTLEYDSNKYLAFLDTLSDHRSIPNHIKIPFYAKIKEEIENSGGNYKVDYVFQLYLGRKRV
ncbi:MAG: class I SAM-dependent methyltransferase [Eubacteriales bacterium]|nr:class I SAM-dependent methyltransferase [Eubacteriales bacterium]